MRLLQNQRVTWFSVSPTCLASAAFCLAVRYGFSPRDANFAFSIARLIAGKDDSKRFFGPLRGTLRGTFGAFPPCRFFFLPRGAFLVLTAFLAVALAVTLNATAAGARPLTGIGICAGKIVRKRLAVAALLAGAVEFGCVVGMGYELGR